MSLHLLNIRGEKFKSFVEPFDFCLNRQPGLYLLRGDNLAEPSLGGNGVGKSTIWDALFWAFTGTTLRNLKNTDVKPWGTSGSTWVEFQACLGEDLITVRRQTSPNALTIESDYHQTGPQDISTEELLRFFNMDETQLLHSLIVGQFGTFFFDMLPAKKQELFSSILSLDVWISRSKVAGQMVKDMKNALQMAEVEYGKLESALATLGKVGYEGDADQWEEEHAIELEEWEATIDRLKHELSTKDISKIDKDRTWAEQLLNDVESTLREMEREIDNLKEDIREVEADKRDADNAIEDMLKDLAVTMDQGECSYCGHGVSDNEIDRLESSTRVKVDELEDKIDSLIDEGKELQKDLKPKQDYYEDQQREREGLLDKLSKLDSEARMVSQDRKRIERELRHAEGSYDKLLRAENPWAKLRDDNESDAIELGAKIIECNETISNLNTAIARTQYWVKGFKDVRLFMIDNYLVDLEVEVNNSIKQLGLDGWRIEFSVDRETQRGTIKKGFEVYVYSPRNTKPVKWECWSGGESSRLKLAGELGLMEMIFTATGQEPNIEVFDEPTSFMSQEGIEDLLELLRERALLKQKQIYIIDHHSINFGGFEGVITIQRDNLGSRILETR
ncbi:SbcC [Vibrio phage R01]|nr:SbcC [Vibrio phage R01]